MKPQCSHGLSVYCHLCSLPSTIRQALPILPMSYAQPIDSAPFKQVEPMADLAWSPAQHCRKEAS